ncbi:MAG: hypothetical protein M3083_06515 [Actinomycetota bacterium]|nr:hypothetical protein [Actinomycetota bacterium]
MTFATTAKTFDLELGGAADNRPNNLLFVGGYPSELTKLVASTRAAITGVTLAETTLSSADCSGAAPTGSCTGLYLQMGFAADQLMQQLDAWSPYVH